MSNDWNESSDWTRQKARESGFGYDLDEVRAAEDRGYHRGYNHGHEAGVAALRDAWTPTMRETAEAANLVSDAAAMGWISAIVMFFAMGTATQHGWWAALGWGGLAILVAGAIVAVIELLFRHV